MIEFSSLEIAHHENFIKFIQDGWFMNLYVAIDFTASNEA